ncbi:MAG: RrF2 family transcriptional regulator [Eubacteriales bacterium]|jgi:Rrf2 family protein
MKVTMETDYALRILYCLAKSQERMDAKSISEEMCVTLRFALKILHKLVHCGMVRSYKGAGGGYELNCTPQEISLADIVEAIEGKLEISKCLDEEICCNRVKNKGSCQFQREFGRINQVLLQEFQQVTLDKFLK